MSAEKDKPYALTPDLAKIIVERKTIRSDAPNTQPGDVGNGHVLVIDADHQMFNGLIYTRRILNKGKTEKYSCTSMGRRHHLHNEVWMFHNGELPDGYVIHHEHRKPDGKFDPDMNDIEWLFIMTQSEHVYYHHVADPYIEKICQNPKCGKKFLAPSYGVQYCCRECNAAVHSERTNRMRKSKVITPEIAKVLEEDIELAKDIFVDAGHDKHGAKMELRPCFYCHRPFLTAANRPAIMCARPDCKGRALLIAISNMQNTIAKRIMARSNGLRTFYNEQFGKLNAYLDDDGVPWFIGKQMAEMLGYKDTKSAIIDHVEENDKKMVPLLQLQRWQITTFASPRGLMFINEFGMNDLIINSQLPAAKQIRHWLTHDVMPKLRQSGYYAFVDNPSFLTDYFTDEELCAAFQFRELNGGNMQALVDLNRLTDGQRQLIMQIIEQFRDANRVPTIAAAPSEPAKD